jgi:hypothetical protein
MSLSKEKLDAVYAVVAEHVGQCVSDPLDALEIVIRDWSKNAKAEAIERLDENIFYCDCCGWYCETDERHAGDLCDDCHVEREDGETDY